MSSLTGRILPCCLFAVFAFFSCVNDNGDSCGDPAPEMTPVLFRFVYEHNTSGQDRFREEVGHVDLFAFTDEGVLILHREIPVSDLDETNSVAVPLPESSFEIVAWGNTDSDDYSFIMGSTRDQMSLKLNYEPDGLVPAHPVHLFHGEVSVDHVDDGVPTPATVRLVKNTCVVRVKFEGLEPGDGLPWEEDVDVWINATNGQYGFDRQIRASERLKYAPRYNDGVGSYEASFAVQRILEDGDMRLISIQSGYEQPIITASVADLIRAGYTGDDFAGYLDIEDEFVLRLVLDKLPGGAYILVKVQVNNWNPIEWGDIEI